MGSDVILDAHHLKVVFGPHTILRDITFSLRRGSSLALIGPNGSGKSVLLRALLGLIPYTGTVTWADGVRIGYVPQILAIDRDLPLTVSEFFAIKNVPHGESITLLERVGMGGEHRDPEHGRRHVREHIMRQRLGTLSGGQLQRIMVAWSLSDNPDVLLFDEPTSGIDIGGQESIYALLASLKEERNLTVVLISHDLDVVYQYADDVLCISHRLVCHGPPRETLDSATLKKLYGESVGFPEHTAHHEH